MCLECSLLNMGMLGNLGKWHSLRMGFRLLLRPDPHEDVPKFPYMFTMVCVLEWGVDNLSVCRLKLIISKYHITQRGNKMISF